MKVVIQRCKSSRVLVKGEIVAQIGRGLNLLVCLEKGDDDKTIERASDKLSKLRVFQGDENKMNQSIKDIRGEFLAISQFTLSWEGEKGNRPSFDKSMPPKEAEKLFNKLCEELSKVAPTKTGVFGQHMSVEIINDGPVTFSLSF